MEVTKSQKEKFNLFYETKFIKFYFKFLIHPGNIKERLLDCFDDFEYAYSLSQSEGVPSKIKKDWQKIWKELLAKPTKSDYRPQYFSLHNTIHRKHYKSLEKYIIFFFEEYERITKVQ